MRERWWGWCGPVWTGEHPGADGRNHFTVTVDAVVSPQFFGWLFGLGDRVELLAPDWAAAAFRAQLDAVGANYGEKQKD